VKEVGSERFAERLDTLQRERHDEEVQARAARARDPGAIKDWLILAPIRIPDEALYDSQIPAKSSANAPSLRGVGSTSYAT
jgi:hypothetical protein